ncbi:MAG: alkaline phosphatase family protein [Deltaproteobacteria bacterium]|nr:alkaline phosphatase family protein [Deltaproteobacteria bacterium]MBW1875522.1 alkaline phosphatase family protein [Deltaproteobacteria bacterium]MBW2211183.1 alkaline phosphatase family protein [Deltaproteobacteria bacterium]MBW2215150.1 alkaline phosphatase family protein [Deltaproteobacteria bacterium]MBW2380938.1 alkaline phosphatase family protein [Deltaproteobacteria bacterium]
MRRLLLFIVTLTLAACDGGASKTKHALVIGIDGLRVDALQQVSTPAMDVLIADGTVTYEAIAGGELGTVTEQRTLSGPGWSSILTGVWVDKHGVEDNGFDDARYDEYPHFFARVREKNPAAYLSSFVTWGPINDDILASAEANAAFSPQDAGNSAEGDSAVTAAVVAHLAAETPDVVFVQLDDIDYQGHRAGFSPMAPEYASAVETVDSQVGEMVDAIVARPTYSMEDWLVVLTTDHGGNGVLHGLQSDEERTIFIIASGGSAVRGRVVSPGPGHTAVPPTVMKHLGLEVDDAWGWESEPFGL